VCGKVRVNRCSQCGWWKPKGSKQKGPRRIWFSWGSKECLQCQEDKTKPQIWRRKDYYNNVTCANLVCINGIAKSNWLVYTETFLNHIGSDNQQIRKQLNVLLGGCLMVMNNGDWRCEEPSEDYMNARLVCKGWLHSLPLFRLVEVARWMEDDQQITFMPSGDNGLDAVDLKLDFTDPVMPDAEIEHARYQLQISYAIPR
jgi:hypothetical protein